MAGTANTTQWLRKRKVNSTNTHYLTHNGHKVKVTFDWLVTVTIGYDHPATMNELVADNIGRVYNSTNREWDDKTGTYFYPEATPEEVKIWNDVITACNQHV